MRAGTVKKIESGIELAATAIFAAAVGFAVFQILGRVADEPGLGAFTAAAAVTAYALCKRVLIRLGGSEPQFPVPIFDLGTIERRGPDELLLTDADRLNPADRDPLVLDDVLAEIGPDSRVVRLFDPAAMPTPGQLKARIDRHLDDRGAAEASPDASQALYDALAELRRSLR
jgi:hypothetical protein